MKIILIIGSFLLDLILLARRVRRIEECVEDLPCRRRPKIIACRKIQIDSGGKTPIIEPQL